MLRFAMWRRALLIFLILIVRYTAPAQPLAASQPTTKPFTREQMLGMFQRELGERYKPADADNYLAAHQAMEQYFNGTSEQRSAIVSALQVTGVDPNRLGRLARIRSGWAD